MKFICFLTLLFTSMPLINAEKVDQPNIIYILADDLGYGDLGCYGQKVSKNARALLANELGCGYGHQGFL